MCVFGATAFIFSLYFPLDLNNVQVSEKGLSKDSSVKKKKLVKPVKIVVVIVGVEESKMVRKLS